MVSSEHNLEKRTALQFNAERELRAAQGEPATSRECSSCGRRFGEGARFCPFDGEALGIAADADLDPLVGSLVDGRYRVESVLGEGGMGTVYRVSHESLSREFALKALRGDLSREGDLAERFLREARSAAAIKHVNVCEITDFGHLPDGRPYFAMELLLGKSLSWWLEKGGPVPVAPGIRIIQQIASVLDEAHQRGIVHRDLKPENVIVADATLGTGVKVVDFGLAQVAGQSRLTRPGVVFGTPHYMSPEQAMGGLVDHRADIYALGIVMYEMFTGRVPFEADTYMGVLTKHMYVAPTPPSEVLGNTKELGAIEDVILRCLQKAPEKRYQRMVDLVLELESLLRPGLDGEVQVAPKRARDATPIAELPRLADDLELPSPAEAQQRRLRGQGPKLPWRVISGVGIGTALVVLAFASWRLADEPAVLPPTSASGGPAPNSSSGVQSVARPKVIAPPATAFTPPNAGKPVPSELDKEAENDPPSQANRRSEASQPPARPRVQTPPVLNEPPPPASAAGKKPDFAGGDIVDPWQD